MNKKTQVSSVTPCDELRAPKPKLRWKKRDKPLGLMRVMYGSLSSNLHDGTKRYATVSELKRFRSSGSGGWYWVARCDEAGVPLKNTCDTPCKTEGEAKNAALEYVKACLATGVAA